jgi:methionyl-tRNA formyltransferase
MLKNIVFMGTSNFAVPVLKSLYQNGFAISCVYTQPPSKSNRGQKLNKSPVNLISETLNIEVRTPHRLKNNEVEEIFLKKINPSLIIVVSYGQLIPKNLLEIPKNGFINVHASLLPKWRGAAPIQRAIMNLDDKTGISIIRLNENLDEGPIINKYEFKISKNMNASELSENLANLASQKIMVNLDNIFEGKAKFENQNNYEATYAKKIDKFEGKINWNETAEKIMGKINGLYPFPGAWFLFNGERYKILKAEISNAKGEIGMVLNDNFEIGCINKSIKIISIQREGKKIQNINEFTLGTKIKKGNYLI